MGTKHLDHQVGEFTDYCNRQRAFWDRRGHAAADEPGRTNYAPIDRTSGPRRPGLLPPAAGRRGEALPSKSRVRDRVRSPRRFVALAWMEFLHTAGPESGRAAGDAALLGGSSTRTLQTTRRLGQLYRPDEVSGAACYDIRPRRWHSSCSSLSPRHRSVSITFNNLTTLSASRTNSGRASSLARAISSEQGSDK